jgi:hypothetical protein
MDDLDHGESDRNKTLHKALDYYIYRDMFSILNMKGVKHILKISEN